MALNDSDSYPDISGRFGIAQDAPVPDDIEARQQVQIQVRSDIYIAAKTMSAQIAESRELSLALTHLEEALMWAGKAIFK